MGRIKPSQGSVKLFGIDPWTDSSPYRRIGYVSESERLYDWMTAQDFVSTLARLHGMTRDEANARAEHVLEFVGLHDVRHKEIGKCSRCKEWFNTGFGIPSTSSNKSIQRQHQGIVYKKVVVIPKKS